MFAHPLNEQAMEIKTARNITEKELDQYPILFLERASRNGKLATVPRVV